MYDYEPEIEDKDLKKVGLELMFMTPEKGAVENWVTTSRACHIHTAYR